EYWRVEVGGRGRGGVVGAEERAPRGESNAGGEEIGPAGGGGAPGEQGVEAGDGRVVDPADPGSAIEAVELAGVAGADNEPAVEEGHAFERGGGAEPGVADVEALRPRDAVGADVDLVVVAGDGIDLARVHEQGGELGDGDARGGGQGDGSTEADVP